MLFYAIHIAITGQLAGCGNAFALLCDPMQSNVLQCKSNVLHVKQSNPMQGNVIQCDAFQCDTYCNHRSISRVWQHFCIVMQSNVMQCNPMHVKRSNPMQGNVIQCDDFLCNTCCNHWSISRVWHSFCFAF